MVPEKQLGAAEGSFEIREIEVEGERPMLLQVTAQGVNYNEPVSFGRGYEAEVEVTVYDLTREWNDRDLEVTTARVLLRREGDHLLADEVYVVENRTSPKKTYHDPERGFRFHLPTSSLRELRSVSARGESGMPVPQQAAQLPDGSGYVTARRSNRARPRSSSPTKFNIPKRGIGWRAVSSTPFPSTTCSLRPPT
jgi:hypothetical protein